MQKVVLRDIGLIDYQEAWDYQQSLFDKEVNRKLEERHFPAEEQSAPNHTFIFCEHPHVYTLGKSGSEENLLINANKRQELGIQYYKINRGGDITYHGPGQIVGYPIFDLDHFFTDIHKYLRYLEEAVILTIAEYGLKGERSEKETGVWLDVDKPTARKICALGMKASRWVTMHGFAFNVNTDLSYFNHIVPCGIDDKDVTSMERELGEKVDINEVKDKLKQHLATLFNIEFIAP